MSDESSAPMRRRRSRDGLFKRNGWWWIDFTDADGKRHRQKAAPSYEVAKLVYRDKMNAIAKGEVTGTKDEAITISTFVETVWWPRTKPRLEASWATRVRGMLDAVVLPGFGGIRLAVLRREMLDAWAAERRVEVRASTFNKEQWVVRNIGKCAAAWGYVRTNPAEYLSRAMESSGRVRFLSDEERDLLLNGTTVTITSSDGRTWTTRQQPNATLRLYIVFALNTGARRAQAIRLQWQDVNMKQNTITFRRTKNKLDITIPMTPTLRATLAALPRPLDPSAFVLPRIAPLVLTRAFARLVQRLGIKDLTFHDLRHDAASTMAQAGVPLQKIARMLGHRDLRMTMRYAHLAPDHLADAVAALERKSTAGR